MTKKTPLISKGVFDILDFLFKNEISRLRLPAAGRARNDIFFTSCYL